MWTRALIVMAAAVVAMATAVVVAPASSADGVWFQSVARASASAPCPDDTFGTPWQSNWNSAERTWRPSWAQWANGGRGGFTCDRAITWARPLYPSAGCVFFQDGDVSTPVKYVNFNGGWNIGVGPRYTDAACTQLLAWGSPPSTGPIDLYFVYAPAGWSAVNLCVQAFNANPAEVAPAGPDGVYFCRGVYA